MTDKILDAIDQTLLNPLKEILQIWEYVGYDETYRQKKIAQMSEKVKAAIGECLKTENTERASIESQLEEYRRSCTELSNNLEIPAFFPPRNLSIYETINKFKEKFEELEKVKKERLDALNKSLDNIKKFTRLLSKDMNEYDSFLQKLISSSDTKPNFIPNQDALDRLEELESRLDAEYTPLLEQYQNYCNTIGKIARDFGYSPTNELEAQILRGQGIQNIEIQRPSTPGIVRSNVVVKQVEFEDKTQGSNGTPSEIQFDEESKQPIIKEELLNFLKTWQSKLVKEKARVMGICEELRSYLQVIWKRLSIDTSHQQAILDKCQANTQASLDILREEMNNCDQLKWEQLSVYVEGIKKEYLQLIELCCVEKDINFENLKNDPETMVCDIEREIDRLRVLYEDNRTIFDTLVSYRKLWDDLYDVEKRMKDPAILSNRGGILLKTEKEKKRILRDLKTAETSIVDDIDKIEGDSKQEQFFNGLNFMDYATKRHKDYEVMLKESSKSSRRVSSAVSRGGPPGAPS